MDRLIAKGISRLANAGRTLGVAFNRRPTDDELRKIHDLLRDPDTLSQEAVRDEALEALEEGYAVLADIKNQWEGRHRLAGQRLLCKMRDAIAKATGRSAEDVQDNPIALKREPNAAAQAGQDFSSAPSNEGHAAGPAPTAPDVAEMVERLQKFYMEESKPGDMLCMEAAALLAKLGQDAPLSTDYIQAVPDKCDRIVWRGRYYHLPLKPGASDD